MNVRPGSETDAVDRPFVAFAPLDFYAHRPVRDIPETVRGERGAGSACWWVVIGVAAAVAAIVAAIVLARRCAR